MKHPTVEVTQSLVRIRLVTRTRRSVTSHANCLSS